MLGPALLKLGDHRLEDQIRRRDTPFEAQRSSPQRHGSDEDRQTRLPRPEQFRIFSRQAHKPITDQRFCLALTRAAAPFIQHLQLESLISQPSKLFRGKVTYAYDDQRDWTRTSRKLDASISLTEAMALGLSFITIRSERSCEVGERLAGSLDSSKADSSILQPTFDCFSRSLGASIKFRWRLSRKLWRYLKYQTLTGFY